MPIPLNFTLTPAAPYVSLYGANGASSWNHLFNYGGSSQWSEWSAFSPPKAVPPSTAPPPGISFVFNGSSVAVYGTMRYPGEGYNVSVTPDIPATGRVENWQGCDPASVCLSDPGILWQRNNLTSSQHNLSISTNPDLGVNGKGPTLSITHIDIITSIPGDESNSTILTEAIPFSNFSLSPQDQWHRAENGSLYGSCTNCTLSLSFTGTAVMLTAAAASTGSSPYLATIDFPPPLFADVNHTAIGVPRGAAQTEGEVMYMASGLNDTQHNLNIRTGGPFAISGAYVFKATPKTPPKGSTAGSSHGSPSSSSPGSSSSSSSRLSLPSVKGLVFLSFILASLIC